MCQHRAVYRGLLHAEGHCLPHRRPKVQGELGGSLKLARKHEHKTLPIAPRPRRLQFEEHRLEALPLWNQVADD